MSVIAAVQVAHEGPTWIGSDTLVTSGNLRLELGTKWIVRGEWAIGVAGHMRAINVIDHQASQLLSDVSGPYVLADRLRNLLQQDGFRAGTEEHGPLEFGQSLMLAHRNGVWGIGADFSTIALPPGRLWAEGSGRDLAIGAAHALAVCGVPPSPDEILRRALETAIMFDVGCGGRPWVFCLGAE